MSTRDPIPGPVFMAEHDCFIAPAAAGSATFVTSTGDENQVFRGSRGVGLLPLVFDCKTAPVIDPDIINSYGGKQIDLGDGETAFQEGDVALHYFQILRGSMKMSTLSPEGKEFIQGIFKTGDSFGEPPLFCDFPYPSSASAIGPCTILKLAKDKFFLLLSENFEAHLLLNKVLCQRLRYKSMVLSEISSYDPEHRILSLLKYLKSELKVPADQKSGLPQADNKYVVPFTRQQLADMCGLRVETVIRTVKKMDRQGKLQLLGRKIAL